MSARSLRRCTDAFPLSLGPTASDFRRCRLHCPVPFDGHYSLRIEHSDDSAADLGHRRGALAHEHARTSRVSPCSRRRSPDLRSAHGTSRYSLQHRESRRLRTRVQWRPAQASSNRGDRLAGGLGFVLKQLRQIAAFRVVVAKKRLHCDAGCRFQNCKRHVGTNPGSNCRYCGLFVHANFIEPSLVRILRQSKPTETE